ncbi:MAG: S41 family peptidase [Bacteroidetes bacterium]|nr:S41 family peptidase [Bacteroidota bacterium]
MGNKKLQVWLPLLFSLVLIAGMFLGYQMNKKGKNNFFTSNRRTPLQEALDIIRIKYVDTVNIDSLEGRAIEEMMTELDPHSVYLPPVDVKEANEDLAGNFQGIGVEFNIFNDTVNVIYVIPGGPSEKAGLITGDQILRVNDSVITKRGFDADAVKKYIKGPAGSKARLLIQRGRQQLAITITRGTIPVSSVDASYMLDKTTGYIRLDKFSEKSYEEFMQALEALKKQGMQQLVFDLRGNGGGLMEEAVDMADEFLDGDKLVVYMQGANTKKKEYRCKRPGLLEKGKLVLLVDELSASASEVLAGSLQDWCRAKIIGRRTFGKGLVQQQYPLSDGAALRLTIARYYTPLGRSIQRSYAKGKKIYMDELWERYSSGEMFSLDSVRNHKNGKKFPNHCNDTLYEGDGITPDIFVPVDTSFSYENINKWLGSNRLNQFVYTFYLEHKDELNRFASVTDYTRNFSAVKLWESIVQKTAGDSLSVSSLSNAEKEKLQLRLKGMLARYRWRNSGFYQVINTDDPVIKKSIEVIEK